MFDFYQKMHRNNENHIDTKRESKEVSEYYELIQTGVNCILESRTDAGLDSTAFHQIAYFVMYTLLLQKIEMITTRENLLVLSVFSIHIEKDIQIDCASTISQFESIYEKCFTETDFATALQRYAYCVETINDEKTSNSNMACSIDCVVQNVKSFLNLLK